MPYRYNGDTWLDQETRKLIIDGYAEMIKKHVDDGWKPNYVNFMFNHIPGCAVTKMDAMSAEVNRVHNILTRNIVKRPKAKLWCHLRPIFIGCHDLPVWKQIWRGRKALDHGFHRAVACFLRSRDGE